MAISRWKILLASKSPRRRQLVSEMGFDVRYVDIDVDEVVPDDIAVQDIPLQLAKLKASGFSEQLADDELLVTADTIVVHGDAVLGKPHSREDAFRMLRMLSGDRHQVYTGVCVKSNSTQRCFVERTDVFFRNLKEETITRYVDMGTCMDKAGAYGIQEWIGMVGVERIEGCYYNVVGLPVARLYETIVHFQ